MNGKQIIICDYTDDNKLLSKKYYQNGLLESNDDNYTLNLNNNKLLKKELYDKNGNVVYTLDQSNNEIHETINHELITLTRINGKIIDEYKLSAIKINDTNKDYTKLFHENKKYFYDIILELIKLETEFAYKIIKQCYYKDGELNGKYEEFDDNEQLKLCGYYKNGLMHGKFMYYYYINDTDYYIIHDKRNKDYGLNNSRYVAYGSEHIDFTNKYYCGSLGTRIIKEYIKQYNYIDGKIDGECLEFENGKLTRQYYCKETETKNTKNMQIRNFKSERITDFIFNPDIKYTGEYKEFKDEQLIEHCWYKDGELDGEYKEFKDDELTILWYYKNGKRDGKQKTYHDSGKIVHHSYYKNGKKDGDYKFYENGKLINHYYYKDGKKDGECKEFTYEPLTGNELSKETNLLLSKGINNEKQILTKHELYKDGELVQDLLNKNIIQKTTDLFSNLNIFMNSCLYAKEKEL